MDFYKVTTTPEMITVVSKPYVVITESAYVPVVDVLSRATQRTLPLRISAKSLYHGLEDFRIQNQGNFVGLEFFISKASADRMALYVLEAI